MPSDASLNDLLLRSSVDGVLAFDHECRYTHWSPAMERMCDLPAESVLGKIAFDVFPFIRKIGEDVNFLRALNGEASSTSSRPYDVPITGRSGFFEAQYSPVRDLAGKVIGGMAIVRDVTERMEVAADQRFRDLVEQAPFSIQMYSLDGLCTYANPAWERFWESDREVLSDYNILKDPHAAEHGVGPLLERAFAGETVTFPDAYYDPAKIRKKGRTRWIRTHFFPVRSSTGQLTEVAEVLEDVTDAKNLESSAADLKKAVQARDTFLSIASHELRTPMTLMKMQIDRARLKLAKENREAAATQKSIEALDHVECSAGRLAKLIDRILDVSRIETGRLNLELEEVSLASLVKEVAERFQGDFASAGIKVDLQLREGPTGLWDCHRIEQVITNLLTNAIRYAPRTPLTIRVFQTDGSAVLEVADSGPGIAAEDHQRIFDRFTQVSGQSAGGLGLGLHIAQEIARAHQGRIVVKSEPGRGTAFRVELPLRPRPGRSVE